MNSRQLQYAVILAETLNFSQAAQNLGISQPAFSKQIISLEEELGVKLFERSTNPLTLTEAGEFFIKKAKGILLDEEKIVKSMQKYKNGESGTLVIGVPPFRSLYMMPFLIAEMKKKYPAIKITLVEKGLAELKKGILDGEFDFAVMNMPVTEPELSAIPLEKDVLVLAVPRKLLGLLSKNGEVPKRLKTLSKCEEIPFVTVGKEQEMRKLFEKLCSASAINPQIYAEVTGITTAWEIVKEGLAATLLPKQFVQKEAALYDVELIEIQQNIYVRQSAVVTRCAQYVSEHAEFAIETIKSTFKK